jgi:hypothetical protein
MYPTNAIIGEGAPLRALSFWIEKQTKKPVVDETGLLGTYRKARSAILTESPHAARGTSGENAIYRSLRLGLALRVWFPRERRHLPSPARP